MFESFQMVYKKKYYYIYIYIYACVKEIIGKNYNHNNIKFLQIFISFSNPKQLLYNVNLSSLYFEFPLIDRSFINNYMTDHQK